VQRAVPFSVEVNMGRVVLVPGPWNKEYIRELMHFPFGRFKDQVDASAGANSLLDGGLRKAGGIRSKKKTEEIYDPAPPRKKMVMQDD
jgi:phage terminase large subunit-like protein